MFSISWSYNVFLLWGRCSLYPKCNTFHKYFMIIYKLLCWNMGLCYNFVLFSKLIKLLDALWYLVLIYFNFTRALIDNLVFSFVFDHTFFYYRSVLSINLGYALDDIILLWYDIMILLMILYILWFIRTFNLSLSYIQWFFKYSQYKHSIENWLLLDTNKVYTSIYMSEKAYEKTWHQF